MISMEFLSEEPEHKAHEPIEARVIRENLEILTNIASPYPTCLGATLYLIAPDGTMTNYLRGPCDQRNRDILDKIYELSHIGSEVKIKTDQVDNSDGTEPTWTQKSLFSDHGIELIEKYSKDGDWESFGVQAWPIDETDQE